ncbi:hypothetical protein QT06_C0001G0468 [archaeon GW2011_AR15]|nr:hypothetical protein QT06_C0001G0468 [archaeon GW2011_AR15]MBS3103779.1 hypothetical protein [Candidatus Woesearchaeota archaeon]
MKCVKCGKPSTVHVQNLDTCGSCFQKIIEKRVRKEVRTAGLIEKNDKILVIDDGSASGKVSGYLLKKIIKGMPVQIEIKQKEFEPGMEIKGDYNKVVVPWNADLEDEYFLSCVMQNREAEFLGHYTTSSKTYVKLLLPVLSSEAEQLAKIRNFSYTEKKDKSPIREMMDKLEEEYPEAKFSLLKSSREFSR